MSEEKVYTAEEAEQEIERLVEEGLKEYEEELRQREAAETQAPDYKQRYINTAKQVEMHKAGFNEKQVKRLSKYVMDTDDRKAMQAEIEELAADLLGGQAKNYGDPSQRKQVWNPFK
ncbi:hypothetical protein [Sediminibacillus massiliensis]|uniref:hypothetical protein n=1 Tax=Sediminibacillus massiliensis TaxID=1926277 RepID=UPI0009888F39|nr:hypothetical protein [Sediminibacillus massiliensis]